MTNYKMLVSLKVSAPGGHCHDKVVTPALLNASLSCVCMTFTAQNGCILKSLDETYLYKKHFFKLWKENKEIKFTDVYHR